MRRHLGMQFYYIFLCEQAVIFPAVVHSRTTLKKTTQSVTGHCCCNLKRCQPSVDCTAEHQFSQSYSMSRGGPLWLKELFPFSWAPGADPVCISYGVTSVFYPLDEGDGKHRRDCYQSCGTLIIAFDVCPHLPHDCESPRLVCSSQSQGLCF